MSYTACMERAHTVDRAAEILGKFFYEMGYSERLREHLGDDPSLEEIFTWFIDRNYSLAAGLVMKAIELKDREFGIENEHRASYHIVL